MYLVKASRSLSEFKKKKNGKLILIVHSYLNLGNYKSNDKLTLFSGMSYWEKQCENEKKICI